MTHDFDESMGDEKWEMVVKKGNQFVVSGQPFYVNGFNTYWLMLLAVDPSTRGKVTDVFQQASSIGLTVCRTLAFNNGGWRVLEKTSSIYDEDVFKAVVAIHVIVDALLRFKSGGEGETRTGGRRSSCRRQCHRRRRDESGIFTVWR